MTATKRLEELGESEIVALAVSGEEEDARILRDMARRLGDSYPATAAVLRGMADEEDGHRRALLDLHARRFGPELPYVTRAHVRGFPTQRPIWLAEDLRAEGARRAAAEMERQAGAFYDRAAARCRDVEVRRLLGDLAAAERGHEETARALEEGHLTEEARDREDGAARRAFALQVVQPGLAGFIDGSVSTLAPLFAAAFATQDPHSAFLVGTAASLGAGVSMGLTEAMSDDGAITGRGSPWLRGLVCGAMTALGGMGHALPYLIPDFRVATGVAFAVVALELVLISLARWKWMGSSFHSAFLQVAAGGAAVVAIGSLIGAD